MKTQDTTTCTPKLQPTRGGLPKLGQSAVPGAKHGRRLHEPTSPWAVSPSTFLIVLILLPSALIPMATAKCCINIDAQSDSNAPQSFAVKVSGRASSFLNNNKRYDIQAVFPTNYALQPPKAVLPMSKPNCTQYVAPPNNNPNGFRCSYETNNPAYMTTFMIEWKVIVPPPTNPELPQPKPEFLEFWVNGDMKCDQETSVDNCPDPATGKPTNATSNAGVRSLTMGLPSAPGGFFSPALGFGLLALGLAGFL